MTRGSGITAARFRQMCLSLDGTTEAPHRDRAAFRVSRIYATLKEAAGTANIKLEPDEQALICNLHGGAFMPVPGGWGDQGWTTVHLTNVAEPVLSQVLISAWTGAQLKPMKARTARKPK